MQSNVGFLNGVPELIPSWSAQKTNLSADDLTQLGKPTLLSKVYTLL
jgi:hypothetical protein